jgi:mRNA interferase HigB
VHSFAPVAPPDRLPHPFDKSSHIWEAGVVTVYGELLVASFAKKHANSRKPLARFLEIVKAAKWDHFIELKETFPTADYTPKTGVVVFDIGGNNYRLTAIVDFEEQLLDIHSVMTHEQYIREVL